MRKYLPLFTILIVFILPIMLIPRLIRINSIECRSQYGKCTPGVTGSFGISTPLSLKKAKKQSMQIIAQNKAFAEASTKYLFPDKLVVSVVEKKPVAAVTNDNMRYYLIDNEGFLLKEQQGNTLPVIIYEGEISEALLTSDEMKFAVEMLRQLYVVHGVQAIRLTADSIEVAFRDNMTLLLPNTGDGRKVLGALTVILSQQEDLEGKTIDLRFEQPVIK